MPVVGLLLLAWSGVGWGIAHVNGYFSVWALLLVLGGGGALTLAVAGLGRPARLAGGLVLLRAGLVTAGLLLVATPLLHRQHAAPYIGPGLAWWAAYLLSGAAAVLLGLLFLQAARGRGGGRGVAVVAGLAIAGDLATLVAAPAPPIDVHVLLQGSADGLLQGRDMYDQVWVGSPGLTDVYPYLPGTTLLLAPARWLLGDVRLGLVAALVVTLVLLTRAARRAVSAGAPQVVVLLPPLVVAFPRAVLLTEDSWTEPLLLALLTGCVLAARSGRGLLAVLCLALALASKQHVALLLPVAALWPALGPRRSAAAAGLGLLVVAPWLLADPRALWHDAVIYNLHQPVLSTALDLPALLLRHGVAVGFGLAAAALLLAWALAARALAVHSPPAGSSAAGSPLGAGTDVAAASALVLLAVALTNKQSFFNHYWLVGGLCVLAAVLSVGTPAPATDAPHVARVPRPPRVSA